MSTPDLLAGFDEIRARRLRSMKRNAAGLLVLAAAVFVATFALSDGTGGWGYVRAASEAAMVGGVADWFAVTALFRHPLGIPIPHTALIPRGKDSIGRGLGEFVQRNFMDPQALVSRIREADPAKRIGEWLSVPENAETAARQAAGVVAAVAEAVNEDEIQDSIREMAAARIETIDAAPVLGSVIDKTIAGGHHEALVSAGLRGVVKSIADNKTMLRSRISDESPWWVPEQVDDVVFEKLYTSLLRFIGEIADNPEHDIRHLLNERTATLAAELKNSPEMHERGEQLKRQLVDHPDFKAWTDGLWDTLKIRLVAAAEQPESDLRKRLEQLAVSTGARLITDADLRKKVDAWIGNLGAHLAERSGPEIASLIATTVERWDADETSRRLELQVGRDLQYIRINGTLVGGLVGVLIHAAVQGLGG
ncbi:MAG: DUF445 domain-containing protein [Acidimicrobiia bacterium]|nr:DUF445 domain-containing protein [Acidimicrobiia bacterium]MDX2466484.1 DUF445 domain-containing protein [Acidimicrobiia bacterium]